MKRLSSKFISSLSISIITILFSGIAVAGTEQIAQTIAKNMVLVKGGQFSMGSDSPSAKNHEKPAHTVIVGNFYLSKFEMTQELFESVTGYSQSYFPDPKAPVNNISWKQVNLFIKKLNEITGEHYRLPTEAEWEFAAKGGVKSNQYTYSGSNNIDEVAWYASNANNKAHPVGLKHPNELGLYDMTGNVGEYVIDAFDENYYSHSPKENPVNAKDEKATLAQKAVRGGSYSFGANESENFRRDSVSQSVIMADLGFRLAKDAK